MPPPCIDCGQKFTEEPDELKHRGNMAFTFGDYMAEIPEPVRCPECRLRLRTAHRNERFLYRRKSDKSGSDIVSLYHPRPVGTTVHAVYSQEEWKSDEFDPLQYGKVFDSSRNFFDQFRELQTSVPRMALITVGNENSDYSTGTGYCKNCYLINSSEYCQDCMYGKLFQKCEDCVDGSYLFDSRLCYECFSVHNSYECTHLRFSKNCTNCHFSSSLLNCQHCFLCTNLERKEYHFRNQALSKEDYERAVAPYRNSYAKSEEAIQELETLLKKSTHRGTNILNSENCSGDYIDNSKNCLECFDMEGSQDSRYVTVGVGTKDCYDCSNMYIKPELCYETLGTIEVYHTAYCTYVFHSQNLLYSEYCFNCSDLFGCSGLTRKKYCIFNKQYTQQEYEALVPKIIESMKKSGEWGAFFLKSLSPFGYNETVANEYFPFTKEEAVKRGFFWREVQDEVPEVKKIIAGADLPDSITDIPDDILSWAIRCTISGRPFRIQKPELAFYRTMGIPCPRQHPDVRYDARMSLRNPRKLWDRSCDKCGKQMKTTFSPERRETVYCEECFMKEMA